MSFHLRLFLGAIVVFYAAGAFADDPPVKPISATSCGPVSSAPKKPLPFKYYAPSHQAEGDCKTVDLRGDLPAVRNQGSSGWCYAFAASDLLSHAIGKPVSSVDVAMRYQKQREVEQARQNSVRQRGGLCATPGADSDEGGEIADAARMALRTGVCLETDSAGRVKAIRDLERLKEQLNSQGSCNQHLVKSKLSVLFPSGDIAKLLQMFNSMETEAWDAYVKLQDEACKDKREPVKERLRVRDFQAESDSKRRTALKEIDRFLAKKQPVGYSSYFYFGGGTTDIAGLSEDDSHATTVVGRQWNAEKGVCEYIVRNSWGKDCEKYDWKGPDGQTINKSPFRCEQGHVWIPENQLLSAMSGITWIEKAK